MRRITSDDLPLTDQRLSGRGLFVLPPTPRFVFDVSTCEGPAVRDGGALGFDGSGRSGRVGSGHPAEARIAAFAELVATAIANAQARLELRGFAEEQAALRRVATLVAGGTSPEAVFAAVRSLMTAQPASARASGMFQSADPDASRASTAAAMSAASWTLWIEGLGCRITWVLRRRRLYRRVGAAA